MQAIWAIEVRDRSVGATTFVCPRCGIDRPGSELEQQRWFSVLRIPLVPLATLDPVVRCDACGHRSDVGVLEIPTTDLLTVYIDDALRHSAATIVRSGRTPSPAACEAAVAIVSTTRRDYDLAQFDADLVGLDDIATTERLKRLAPELSAHGKQSFLHRMAALAQIDGEMTVLQWRTLVGLGVALGMPAPHINSRAGSGRPACFLRRDRRRHRRPGRRLTRPATRRPGGW